MCRSPHYSILFQAFIAVLYHLLASLGDVHILFNLFRFQTFRAAGGMLTALLLSIWLGPMVIERLRMVKMGQVIREDGPQTHLEKRGTPTMGGVLILSTATISTLLWAEISRYTISALIVFLFLGGIGYLDDYLKVVRKNPEGLKGRYKMLGQLSVGIVLGCLMIAFPMSDVDPAATQIPFFKDLHIHLFGWAFVAFVAFVIAGSSNAVNLTDGLDGLAAGLSAIAAFTFAIFAYLVGRVDTSSYLNFFHLPGAGELAIFCAALGGACLGFLWFNAHPAEVFMGDTGSLAIGGALGGVAVLLKLEFMLAIIGGVFVLEALSVMLQTTYFKWTKRTTGTGQRILRMAPLHHHFEQLGWHENKVIIRFWIIGVLFALLAFATLKIR